MRSCYVFHAGALGDHVMIWPMLRALLRQRWRVSLVCDRAKGQLAAEVLSLQLMRETGRGRVPDAQLCAIEGEQPRFLAMWNETSIARGGPIDAEANLVLTFLFDDHPRPGEIWLQVAHRCFPQAEIVCIGSPGSATRAATWQRFQVHQDGYVPARRPHEQGPILLHVGAGGERKRWPLQRFIELRSALQQDGHDARLIAGEVEQERFTPADRQLFTGHDGLFIHTLDDLAQHTLQATLFVACDSGPGHLAAQLGVTTLALFGPTDPSIWAPSGLRVRVLAPDSPRDMNWLDVTRAHALVSEMLARR